MTLSVVQQEPKEITRYAGLDGDAIKTRLEAQDAIGRRILQAKAITALMGAVADEEALESTRQGTLQYASWAVTDLLDEAQHLVERLNKLPE